MDADATNLSGFATRMNEIADDMEVPAGRGRQAALAAEFKVTPKAARKWLLGLGYPEMGMAVRIADWADVNLTWLLQGAGPKRGNRVDTKVLVLDEALRSLPTDERRETLNFIRYKLEKAREHFTKEKFTRYSDMLESFEPPTGKKAQ
jgi:transcriptional regulator with XRE-family HTH domain